jgi:hypothetical protein
VTEVLASQQAMQAAALSRVLGELADRIVASIVAFEPEMSRPFQRRSRSTATACLRREPVDPLLDDRRFPL